MAALTMKKVAAITRPGRHKEGTVKGLYLQVTDAGVKSWLLRYEHFGRERYMGLGPIDLIDLKAARERALAARRLLLDGIDPLEARRADRAKARLEAAKTVTFEDAAAQYFDQHSAKWKNAKHRQQFLNTLKAYAYPVIGKLPVGAIDTGLVLRVLEPQWHQKPETMSRVRNRIEAVLDWCAVRGFRPQGDNPARWAGHLANVLPARGQLKKPNHHAALPYVALPAFLADLRQRDGVSARALEFTILTAARTGEAISAKWSEIDLDARTWTVPADRMKTRREHRVPLSDRSLELLKELPRERDNDFLFIGPQKSSGLSNMAMAAVLKRMGQDKITIHGFRSTFRDWAAERSHFPNHVIEMALAHTIGNKVEAAYRRGDLFAKRKQLMDAWARYCANKPADASSTIVALHGARR